MMTLGESCVLLGGRVTMLFEIKGHFDDGTSARSGADILPVTRPCSADVI